MFFSALFFMFTRTWITEKELERAIENKGDEFCRKKNMEIKAVVRKWAASKVKMRGSEKLIKVNMKTGNKTLGKHIRQFLHKNIV